MRRNFLSVLLWCHTSFLFPQRHTNVGKFFFCISTCLQIRYIRASRNSNQFPLPMDCTDFAFSFVQNRFSSSSIKPTKTTQTLRLKNTTRKLLGFQHCGHYGTSKVTLTQRQGCLQLRNQLNCKPHQLSHQTSKNSQLSSVNVSSRCFLRAGGMSRSANVSAYLAHNREKPFHRRR